MTSQLLQELHTTVLKLRVELQSHMRIWIQWRPRRLTNIILHKASAAFVTLALGVTTRMLLSIPWKDSQLLGKLHDFVSMTL